MLERNHKGNFAASAYDGGVFKSGFIAKNNSINVNGINIESSMR